jgi:hypothetical protein
MHDVTESAGGIKLNVLGLCCTGKVSFKMLMVYVNAMGGKFRFLVLMSWFLLVELCRVGATVWLSYWTGITDRPGQPCLPALYNSSSSSSSSSSFSLLPVACLAECSPMWLSSYDCAGGLSSKTRHAVASLFSLFCLFFNIPLSSDMWSVLAVVVSVVWCLELCCMPVWMCD